jgi:FkbM family methyltransferase
MNTIKLSIKNTLKKMLNLVGFEIHRNTKHGEDRRGNLDEVLQHFLRLRFKPKTVIDVGVATGTNELYRNFSESKHLLIEPLKEFEEYLKKICFTYRAEYTIAAAGPKVGRIAINVHKDLLGSSLYKESDGNYVDGLTRIVPMVTIDGVCRAKSLTGPYLIKIDVQGAERLVLEGAHNVLKDTEVIILEVHFFNFYINGPQFYDIVNFMKKCGFVAYDIFGGYNRPFDYALASVDMVFVKENGHFRKNHYFAPSNLRDSLNKLVLQKAFNP